MDERLSTNLDQALALMRAGASVEDCLARFPADAAALEPLLRIADALAAQAAAPLGADMGLWPDLYGVHELAAIAALRRPTRHHRRPLPSPAALDTALDLALLGGPPLPGLGELAPLVALGDALHAESLAPLPREMQEWLLTSEDQIRQMAARRTHAPRPSVARTPRTAVQAIVAAVCLTFALLVADKASAESLPGQPLYAWKLAREDLTVAITTDAGPRGWLHVRYAQERMVEAQALVAGGAAADSPLVAGAMYSALEHSRSALSNAAIAHTYPEVQPAISKLVFDSRASFEQIEQDQPAAPDLAAVQHALEEIAGTPLPPAGGALPQPTVRPAPSATLAIATPLRTAVAPSPTRTPVPEATPTALPPATATLPTTEVASATSIPTVQPTESFTATAQASLTPTAEPPTPTPAATARPSATASATLTPTPTATSVPSATPTATATATPTATATFTPMPSAISTATATPAPSATPTAEPATVEPPSATPTAEPATAEPPSATPTAEPAPSEIATAQPQE